jgi:transposase InsO family protein
MYRGPPSQGWRTFLTNHADGIAAIDLFVLLTITFRLLYCIVILRHGRRLWVSFGVTANPTAEWISHQITEAFPWDSAPRYLIRDRDTAYGPIFVQRLRAMGIRDKAIAPGSPWQNAYAERLIGTIRRECLMTRSMPDLEAFSSASIGIGGSLAAPPLPHHLAYGSVPRRFEKLR